MADRDASRIRIQLPTQDTDGDGDIDASTDTYLCVTDGPNWSGFTRSSVETTCSETTGDGWGNLVRTFRAGKLINMGTITLTVDWDPTGTTGGREFVAFMTNTSGVYKVKFPAEGAETAGPIINITGHMESFTPQGTVLADGQDSRSLAQMVLKISGITFTAAV